MESVKIFSTQRTDLNSYTIDNEILKPIRCGAALDKKDSLIQGDNEGINISEGKRRKIKGKTQHISSFYHTNLPDKEGEIRGTSNNNVIFLIFSWTTSLHRRYLALLGSGKSC